MIETVTDPSDMRALFPLLDEGVQAIKARDPHLDEIGADVYAMALDGTISLALLADGDRPWGWAAFYPTTAHDSTTAVVAWMNYIRPGAPRHLLDELVEFLDGLALATGGKHVRFMTTRMAWARRLAPHGYYVAGITLEKEVGDGQEVT